MELSKKEKDRRMHIKILTRAIGLNSDMIKDYRICSQRAEQFGKIFILKNNQPDAVLFSIAEYERLSEIIEHLESLEDKDVASSIKLIPKEGERRTYTIENMKYEFEQNEKSN